MKAWIKLYNLTGEVLTILILLITLAIIYRSVGLFDCFAFLPENTVALVEEYCYI